MASMEGPRLNIDDLANELLASQAGPEVEPTTAPKPGSKKYLMEQISKVCEASGVPQKETARELSRMSRSSLQALVAEYVTLSEKKAVQDTLGAKSSCDAVLAVTMLRMAHDTAFKVLEPGVDSVAKEWMGMTIEGFTENLRQEPMNEQLNEVLRELVRENPDILGWASNPWARLGLIYAQAMAFTARRYIPEHQTKTQNAPDLDWGPEAAPRGGGAMVLMITGARKTGKSYMCSHLLRKAALLPNSSRPDLVICCCGGSQADYVPIIKEHWDERFLFDRLPGPEFMQRLLDQQRALDATGTRRNVLVIMDDAPVDKETRNAIIEIGFRGRHYGVSLWILAISFVMAPKPLRRSLDALIILSGLPLQSDRKALTEDFCGRSPQHALWALENLKTHQALVCLLTKGRFSTFTAREIYRGPIR